MNYKVVYDWFIKLKGSVSHEKSGYCTNEYYKCSPSPQLAQTDPSKLSF